MKKNSLGILSVLVLIWCSCSNHREEQKTVSGLERKNFQSIVKGKETDLFTLKNASGMEICITNYGGRIVSIMVPDRDGKLQDVVLGFDNIQEYVVKPSSFGATVGRFANRIAYGKFPLDGDTVSLGLNNGNHTIHGGAEGWQNQVFDAEQVADSLLLLRYVSKDGEAGFPGEVHVEVSFRLEDDHTLKIDYLAKTDKKTVINMTNHSFFNLSGGPKNAILDHVLLVNADAYTPLNGELITTGDIENVASTAFDFTNPISVEAALQRDSLHPQLQLAQGFDHNYVLRDTRSPEVPAARVYSPRTGILLDVYTTEPGLQVYTGNMLDGSRQGKGGIFYHKYAGLCLEPQHYPDSPNKPNWPSTILEPGNTYTSSSIYRFGLKE
ncbi:galactose mutarotase [Parapusillimonas sp. SGNA-6]|uniref:aldose epimerase family protein n=1 Tax=Parapedobacter sp. SGR-10 TaxID=2710879 RepID=UPI0013CFC197|nr:aldose epimerase family protein [Parapedobacter sp. SGR-10]NGF55110.1 galactose mutarotase [Parapedobacter sp. SGR-10]NGM90117.1 galactose mutarotase [Parapusillimonas sp. SGNA-6]